MGYFSNSSEGAHYGHLYCRRCTHWDDDAGCPVWEIHQLYNYDQAKNTDEGRTVKDILDRLIPFRPDGMCAQCAMFLTNGHNPDQTTLDLEDRP